MTINIRKTLAGSAALLASASGVLVLGGVAHAAPTPPPWEPDVQSPAPPYGTLGFYDANGNEVTSGTGLDQLFSYAEASTALYPAGVNKSTLYFAAPNHAEPTGSWYNTIQSASTTNPETTAPGALATSPDPVTDSTAPGQADLNAFLGGANLDSTAGYANIIQVRLITTKSRSTATSSPDYWDADIAYNTGSSDITVDGVDVPPNSWAEIYGTFPTVTPPANTPEAPLAIGLPLAGLAALGGGIVFLRRRRSDTTTV